VHLAAQLGDQVLATSLDGDGAGSLVRAWGTRHYDGTVDVLAWNGTINMALLDGDPRLDRHVQITVTGLQADRYQVRLARVDQSHSNLMSHCPADVTWPDEQLWARLRDRDELHTERLPDVVPTGDSTARFDFRLPMPGVTRIRLSAGPALARLG
jgi:xylan 1,4-beta-xylosidase